MGMSWTYSVLFYELSKSNQINTQEERERNASIKSLLLWVAGTYWQSAGNICYDNSGGVIITDQYDCSGESY